MVFIMGGAYQGKTEYAKTQFGEGYKILNHYHQRLREEMLQGLDPMQKAMELVKEDNQLIIISDELGCGVVPVDAFEREYRELSGRINCYFAKEAEQVIRVICGIGTRLK